MWKLISISCAWTDYKEEIENIWNSETNEQEAYEYLIPDNAEILVEHTKIIEWEAVNLSVTIMKDWKKMDNYHGTIVISIVDEDWVHLVDLGESTLLSRWFYIFKNDDWWYKEFQKWLTINKEWEFYIEVTNYNDIEDKVLWKQKIEVIKK